MSTWTDERHEAARARCEAATDGPWESCGGAIEGGPTSGRDVVTTEVDCMSYCYGGTGRGVERPEDREFIAHARTDLADALDEIERLRAESARRMVWLENEQRAHAQTHAALVDMTERAARPEITDDMVERAARQVWAGVSLFRDPGTLPDPDSTDAAEAGMGLRYRRAARAALEAALNPKENEA